MSKSTYMCILRSEQGDCSSDERPSPAQMEAMMKKYQDWQDKFKDNILDMGGKLSQTGSVIRRDQVQDGPFVETKEIIGGYMMITADSLSSAIDVIKQSPMVENPGVSIELREISTP